jgi:hypothetical protein
MPRSRNNQGQTLDVAGHFSLSPIMATLSLSTTFDRNSEKSLLSLDWVLTSGLRTVGSLVSGPLSLPYHDGAVDTVCRLQVQLSVTSSLPFDLVLGRDWLQICRDSLPRGSFHLTSGPLDIHPRRIFLLLLYRNLFLWLFQPVQAPDLKHSAFPQWM